MRTLARKIKKLFQAVNMRNIKAMLGFIKNHGFRGFLSTCIKCLRLSTQPVADEYLTWIDNNEPKHKKLESQKNYVSCQGLKFQIVCNPSEKLNASLEQQSYSLWEMCSTDNLNEVIENSNSDYTVFIGENITLAPFCLYELVLAIEHRDCILIYSDNDKLIDGNRLSPHFKPGFSKDTILSSNYIGAFIAVKTNFLKAHKSILKDLHENIIYDILLKVSEKTRKIEHIEKILYHETLLKMPINTADEKKIIESHLNRTGLEFNEIKDGKYHGHYKVDYKIKGNPMVSLVVPNMDHVEDLDKLLKSVKRSTYENYEVIIVENNSTKQETFDYYEKVSKEDSKVKVVTFNIDYFNYSAIVNFGVEHSHGEYIVLLNNDIEFITRDWIEEMLMYAQRPDVGICGAKLYFSDRSIQHAGVTIGIRGLAGHRARETAEADFTPDDYINTVQNLSAVTAACFMVRKQLYMDMLGFDEKLAVAFNDVDFCLNIRDAKYLIVYNPFVEAYHYESKSRGEDTENAEKQKRFAKEYTLFVKRWSKIIAKGDPYYNRNFRLDTDLPKINYNKIWN